MPTFDTQDHIHLWAVGGSFVHGTTLYWIAFEGIQENTVAIATHRRALDGTAHLHALTDDGTGLPVKFKNVNLILLPTQDQFDALKSLQGRRCYYIPIRHMDDDAPHAVADVPLSPGYRVVMLPLGEPTMIDPALEYWRLPIQLVDDEATA